MPEIVRRRLDPLRQEEEKGQPFPWMADSALSLMGLEARTDQPPADYREMYLTMARAAEESLRILIEAREKCGEISFRSTEE